MSSGVGAPGGGRSAGARHSVSSVLLVGRGLRHSGSVLLLLACLGAMLGAQEVPLQLDLRSGKQLTASALIGSPKAGFEATVDGRKERIAGADLLAVRRAAARAPELLRIELAGGDQIHGAIAGGDEVGDVLELLSPMLGKIALPIDRVSAVVQPFVHANDQVLPDGVDEALFLPTGRGFDLLAGTLHRFGPQGIRFQSEGAEAPQWFAPRAISALRLRSAVERQQPASMILLTRTADRLGVSLLACSEQGLDVAIDGGEVVHVRWSDVASLCFTKDVTHLSSMTPAKVVESGFDGEVVHSWRRDRCVLGGELLVQGLAYGCGIGMHSRSRLSFVVPEGATHFRTRVAMDDTVAELPVKAQAQVRLLLGNKLLFEEKELIAGQPPHDAGLHVVVPGDTITLEVDFGIGRDIGDRVDWLLPMFLMRSQS